MSGVLPIVHVEGYNKQGKLVAITFDAAACNVLIGDDGWFQASIAEADKHIGIGCCDVRGEFVHIHFPVPQIGEPDVYVSLNAEGKLQKYSQHPAAREYAARPSQQHQLPRPQLKGPQKDLRTKKVYAFKHGARTLFLVDLYNQTSWKLYLFFGGKLVEGQSLAKKRIKLQECEFDGMYFHYVYYSIGETAAVGAYRWVNAISLAPNFTATTSVTASADGAQVLAKESKDCGGIPRLKIPAWFGSSGGTTQVTDEFDRSKPFKFEAGGDESELPFDFSNAKFKPMKPLSAREVSRGPSEPYQSGCRNVLCLAGSLEGSCSHNVPCLAGSLEGSRMDCGSAECKFCDTQYRDNNRCKYCGDIPETLWWSNNWRQDKVRDTCSDEKGILRGMREELTKEVRDVRAVPS